MTAQMYEGDWTWTPNSTWVNEVPDGHSYVLKRRISGDVNLNPANPWPNGYGMNTGVTNPLFSGCRKYRLPASAAVWGGNSAGVRGPEGEVNLVDNVSYLRGKHSFKFGFEYVDIV